MKKLVSDHFTVLAHCDSPDWAEFEPFRVATETLKLVRSCLIMVRFLQAPFLWAFEGQKLRQNRLIKISILIQHNFINYVTMFIFNENYENLP